ncbi:hypothetical protein ABZ930_33200 [Streptomyces sp. NPDC046716]|uniref:hypothetical protein n=1 Tax=Streptomyces sp. NPDC046716 TaxID=3157093 RepID=UPI0033C5FE2D
MMITDAIPTPLRMRDFPGHSLSLTYAAAENASQPVTADIALTALLGLYATAGGVPLTLELATAYWDADFGFPLDHPVRPDGAWALHTERFPPGLRVRPRAKDQRVSRVPVLDPSSCRGFVVDALRTNDRDVTGRPFVGWRSMEVHACAVRLPAGVRLSDGMLPVQLGRGIVRTPVEMREGARWAAGPSSPSMMEAPLECLITQEYGEVELMFSAYWTPWCPGGSEYPALRRAVEALVGSGWELAFEG